MDLLSFEPQPRMQSCWKLTRKQLTRTNPFIGTLNTEGYKNICKVKYLSLIISIYKYILVFPKILRIQP